MWHGLEGIGWGWIAMGFLHLALFALLCIALLVALFRLGERSGANALEILRSRYAKGEITREEFERMKRELGEQGN